MYLSFIFRGKFLGSLSLRSKKNPWKSFSMKQILCMLLHSLLTILLEIRILSIQCDLNTDLGPTKNSPSLPYLMPFSYFQFHAWINADFLPKKRPAKIHTQVLNIIEQLMNWNPPGYSAKAPAASVLLHHRLTEIYDHHLGCREEAKRLKNGGIL